MCESKNIGQYQNAMDAGKKFTEEGNLNNAYIAYKSAMQFANNHYELEKARQAKDDTRSKMATPTTTIEN